MPELLLLFCSSIDSNRINTYQYGDRVFTHDASIHSGSNEVTLQYPSDLIDTGEFRICVRSNIYDETACDTGYNSEAKQLEHVFYYPNSQIDTLYYIEQSYGEDLARILL